jgi:molybdopterin synthase catalytic subunit
MTRDIQIHPYPLLPIPAPPFNALSGAYTSFTGTIRNSEANSPILAIHYEAFLPMAHHQFHLILNHIESTWPIHHVAVHHAIGRVPAGHTSIWACTQAAHRRAAFAALQFLLDRMKLQVPIWKHVEYEDGSVDGGLGCGVQPPATI